MMLLQGGLLGCGDRLMGSVLLLAAPLLICTSRPRQLL
jgi:hypothetical protein